MSTPKVLRLVKSCGSCPNYTYSSGGVYSCSEVDQDILDKNSIAPFCPLADYPSQGIADMARTIDTLREPYKYHLGIALIAHVATKLSLSLGERYTITIPLIDGVQAGEAHVHVDCITGVSLNPVEILFSNGSRTFKLNPDANPPALYEACGDEKLHWRLHTIGKG